MPEGDTIFRTARALGRALAGKPVTGFRSTFPLLTRFHEDTPLVGQLVESVESRGKWLLIHFSGGGTLASHLLMSGSWHIYRPGERWQQPRANMRIVIENSEPGRDRRCTSPSGGAGRDWQCLQVGDLLCHRR